jgi:hypothetical protein
MEMVRSHVVTIEVKEQLPNRSLSQILEGWVGIRVESRYISWNRIRHGRNSPIPVTALVVTA